jgi:hypothetical protein
MRCAYDDCSDISRVTQNEKESHGIPGASEQISSEKLHHFQQQRINMEREKR